LDKGAVEAGAARLHVLGCFEMVRGDERPIVPTPAQRLVVLLALRGEPVRRAHIAGVLWPEIEHDHALANVRSALWRLRHSFPGIVTSTVSGLRAATHLSIDLRDSESLAHLILRDRLEIDGARTAIPSLSVDLLPDWDDEWLEFDRERFRDLRIHALERLSEQLSAFGEHAQAVQSGLLAVQAEPLRESAHLALMRAHLAEGNRARALQVYRTLERQLETELQVAPSQTTIDLALEQFGPTLQGARKARATISASG